MPGYLTIKLIHAFCAVLSVTLFTLRICLDASGRPGWRQQPLRWLPHLNDTLLLGAAITLLVIAGWNPLVHSWLGLKILLLLGYIAAGMVALRQALPRWQRAAGALLALAQVGLIIFLAIHKPELF